ncbi:hypothetical protein JRO89_XS10G0092000 [Xanthoceras sorbifolium]|uniref:Uncharacterized protein n=1 Tax=Xanthoceras sorbifolium TaxID=99658 RepID=A0ABQ8HI55_9ROSI|nr:hypothetical protein JRO89_XS10G0092000 [Xanthoceras sorbifolium]
MRHQVRDNVPDLVFRSETLVFHVRMEHVRVRLDFSGKFVVNNSGHRGRLCLLWSDSVSVNLHSFSRWHIDVMVLSNSNWLWRFTGVYGNPQATQWVHSCELLRWLKNMSSLPIGGEKGWPRVTGGMNNLLDARFTNVEVKKAVFTYVSSESSEKGWYVGALLSILLGYCREWCYQCLSEFLKLW